MDNGICFWCHVSSIDCYAKSGDASPAILAMLSRWAMDGAIMLWHASWWGGLEGDTATLRWRKSPAKSEEECVLGKVMIDAVMTVMQVAGLCPEPSGSKAKSRKRPKLDPRAFVCGVCM